MKLVDQLLLSAWFWVFYSIFPWHWKNVIMEHDFHWPMVFIHGIGDFSSIRGGKGEWKRHVFWILFIWMGSLVLPSLG